MGQSDSNHLIVPSDSPQTTRSLGQHIGVALEPGTVIALNGTLGSGKTTLTQGLAQGAEVDSDSVVSPTFTIGIPYAGRIPIFHLDAYRIKSPEEVDELGLDELVESGVSLVVEWAQRIAELLPPVDLTVEFTRCGDQQRQIQLKAGSERGHALLKAVQQAIFG